jgi:signal transduction histidine kinase
MELIRALGLLLVWLIFYFGELAISLRWPLSNRSKPLFIVYLIVQILLTLVLLHTLGYPDFLAVLFAILSMQVMQRLNFWQGVVWIGLFNPLIAISLLNPYGLSQAIALALIFTALNVFLASYSLKIRSAESASIRNLALAQELQDANSQLHAYSQQLEHLSSARERHRLARDLHDSVTQTIFSMTLTTQSAMLLMDHHPDQVKNLLQRLNNLTRSALSEIHLLITELRPIQITRIGLAAALSQHIAERQYHDRLSITLDVKGNRSLTQLEEQGLFRIAQEALNNIVKHSEVSQAWIRLHLDDPLWIEILDQGRGFDLLQVLSLASTSGHVGLVSMQERAVEIGWELLIDTSPGAGTRIRVEKPEKRGSYGSKKIPHELRTPGNIRTEN